MERSLLGLQAGGAVELQHPALGLRRSGARRGSFRGEPPV